MPKIHAVIGGFHLSGLGEERIARVTDAFRALELDYVVPQHCTGFEALVAVKRSTWAIASSSAPSARRSRFSA